MPTPAGGAYAAAVGQRLRDTREAQGLSLGDVAAQSGGRWTTTAVDAWEHGHTLGVETLAELAAIYRVPAASLLPGGSA